MILVTGGTGFIGRILVSHLVTLGYPVRLLLNPSRDYPKLPRGVSVEVAISSMNDERNLRASMKDIDTVFHLVGTEWKGIHAEFEEVAIRAARMFRLRARRFRGRRPSRWNVIWKARIRCGNAVLAGAHSAGRASSTATR